MPKKKYEPNDFPWSDQPIAAYPVIPVPESLSRSSYCRGCGGDGDGICEYHANMFKKVGQRWSAINRRNVGNE